LSALAAESVWRRAKRRVVARQASKRSPIGTHSHECCNHSLSQGKSPKAGIVRGAPLR
jgi:hypothetical protein